MQQHCKHMIAQHGATTVCLRSCPWKPICLTPVSLAKHLHLCIHEAHWHCTPLMCPTVCRCVSPTTSPLAGWVHPMLGGADRLTSSSVQVFSFTFECKQMGVIVKVGVRVGVRGGCDGCWVYTDWYRTAGTEGCSCMAGWRWVVCAAVRCRMCQVAACACT